MIKNFNRTKLIVLTLLLLKALQAHGACRCGVSHFTPRSVSTNAARALMGEHRYQHQHNKKNTYGVSSAAVEYTRSFNEHRLAEYFFGSDTLCITGSQIFQRSCDHLLADYFGLSPEFSSTVNFEPFVSNVIVDLSTYWQHGRWYGRVWAPLNWQMTSMGICETVHSEEPSAPFSDGYMGNGIVCPPYCSFTQAINGCEAYGDVRPLCFGKICCGSQHQFGVADVHALFGYDLYQSEYGFAGFNIQVGIPTGNRPNSVFLLEPIVGNGKHFELGLGFSGGGVIWEKDDNQKMRFLVDVNASHLFKASQCRSFDVLCNCWGNRYSLVKEFDSDGNYNGTVLPLICASTLCCDVEIAIQFDIVFMFTYQHENFGFDFGINPWIRSKEKICCQGFPANQYGFKGIQNVIGMGATTNDTQSTATITGAELECQLFLQDMPSPVLIGPCRINEESGSSPRQFTNKFFWYGYYVWNESSYSWIDSAYLGLGGEIEFEGIGTCEVLPNNNSLSQWGLLVKGGFNW